MKARYLIFAILSTTLISACGGGSGSTTPPSPLALANLPLATPDTNEAFRQANIAGQTCLNTVPQAYAASAQGLNGAVATNPFGQPTNPLLGTAGIGSIAGSITTTTPPGVNPASPVGTVYNDCMNALQLALTLFKSARLQCSAPLPGNPDCMASANPAYQYAEYQILSSWMNKGALLVPNPAMQAGILSGMQNAFNSTVLPSAGLSAAQTGLLTGALTGGVPMPSNYSIAGGLGTTGVSTLGTGILGATTGINGVANYGYNTGYSQPAAVYTPPSYATSTSSLGLTTIPIQIFSQPRTGTSAAALSDPNPQILDLRSQYRNGLPTINHN